MLCCNPLMLPVRQITVGLFGSTICDDPDCFLNCRKSCDSAFTFNHHCFATDSTVPTVSLSITISAPFFDYYIIHCKWWVWEIPKLLWNVPSFHDGGFENSIRHFLEFHAVIISLRFRPEAFLFASIDFTVHIFCAKISLVNIPLLPTFLPKPGENA